MVRTRPVNSDEVEDQPQFSAELGKLTEGTPAKNADNKQEKPVVTATGLKVLVLLAIQNCTKNLLVRYVMKDQPKFLTSAAVVGSESTKLTLSILYILLVEKRSVQSIIQFLKSDWHTTMLVLVPASAYNLQMSLEYVAMASLDAAIFSVLVQSKLVFTATFAAVILRKKLRKLQVISLVLLTVGVMLCNLSKMTGGEEGFQMDGKMVKGISATMGIALSSGFASVYTEKVIKGHKKTLSESVAPPSLAYTQVQLASMSLFAVWVYAMVMDFRPIINNGLFHNFTSSVILTVLMSALGGLTVAAVLKYADSILKGYATALSVILTGILSVYLFGTDLNLIYGMGVINVIIAVLLYNGQNLDEMIC